MSIVEQILLGVSLGMGAISIVLTPLILALLWNKKEKP